MASEHTSKTPPYDLRFRKQDAKSQARRLGLQKYQEGWSVTEIARELHVDRKTAYLWIKEYKECGEDIDLCCTPKKRGPKEESRLSRLKLSPFQTEELREILIHTMPSDHGLSNALWTRKGIKSVIENKFGVKLSLSAISSLMERMEFTFQRPSKEAIQRSAEELRKWLEETYPKIRKMAKRAGARILWQDESRVKQDSNWLRGWAPKGVTPKLPEDKRAAYGGYTLLAALSNKGDMHFKLQKDVANASNFIVFLQELMDEFPGKRLFVILDNAKFHHAKMVQAWVKKQRNLDLFFLPAYCPEYNPVEVCNGTLKTKLRMTKAMTHEQARDFADVVLTEMKNDPDKVKANFHTDTCIYAADKADRKAHAKKLMQKVLRKAAKAVKKKAG